MKPMFSRILGALAAVVFSAHAAAFPTKPIRVIVPFPPGGPSDFVARLVASHLGTGLGGTVIVESRPGASTAIGTDATAKAEPDGHTILVVGAMTLVSLPHLQKGLPFKLDDLMIINQFAATPFVLAVNAGVQAKSVQELIALAKESPGKLNYGHSGRGQSYHLMGELFKMRTGVNITDVPYKGSAPALAMSRCVLNEVR
jgi:tripartite-type tricarboxylate transporter receptor subunit TctC